MTEILNKPCSEFSHCGDGAASLKNCVGEEETCMSCRVNRFQDFRPCCKVAKRFQEYLESPKGEGDQTTD